MAGQALTLTAICKADLKPSTYSTADMRTRIGFIPR